MIFFARVAQPGDAWKGPSEIGQWFDTLHSLSRMPAQLTKGSAVRTHAVWRTAVADSDIRQHHLKPRLPQETIRRLDTIFSSKGCIEIDSALLQANKLGNYFLKAQEVGKGRRPFLTSTGCLAIGPEGLRHRDDVVVICGASVPCVVRRRMAGGGFDLIGEAYVDGCMDGQIITPDVEIEEIKLY